MSIEHLKGTDNVVADALSRVSPQPTPKEGEDEEEFIPVHMLTEEIPPILRELEFSDAQLQKTLLPAY